MIEIKFTEGMITVKGHANTAPFGQDLVCCGVSVLFQNLIISILELTEHKIAYSLKAGDACLEYGDLSEQLKLLIDSFFVGVKQIADEHPNAVKIV